jgi:phage terminase small subunit
MTVLNSRRQETFAQAVARGVSPKEAASLAGYSLHSACCIAAQLMKQQKVSERIRELRENPPVSNSTAGQAHAVAITDVTGKMIGMFIPAAALSEPFLNRALEN